MGLNIFRIMYKMNGKKREVKNWYLSIQELNVISYLDRKKMAWFLLNEKIKKKQKKKMKFELGRLGDQIFKKIFIRNFSLFFVW